VERLKLYFEVIDKARKTLGLGKKATIDEIKKAYRELAKENHPDRYKEKDRAFYEKKMSEINSAYETIMDYVRKFEISFEKEIVEQYDPEKPIKRFKDDWLGR